MVTSDYFSVDYQNGTPTIHYYRNVSNKNEMYFRIYTSGTSWLQSIVTFKPANIPDAPVMKVNTSKESSNIYLPRSVDEWEIKYYSRFLYKPTLEGKYLKNFGVINLNEYFGDYINNDLVLKLRTGQCLHPLGSDSPCYEIPEYKEGYMIISK